MSACESFYGLYRGTVLQNIDPENRGRLLINVPDVLKLLPSTWAEPSVPLAGPTGPPMGMYAVPPIGAGVWVQFEGGDVNHPIWTGCRWGQTTDIPTAVKLGNPASPPLVIQSLGQHTLSISDVPPTPATGGIVLRSFAGAMIVVNDSGIFITNGKGATITLVGKQIDFNVGALTILN
jgi:Type VI secretion system/phage-baseplate injector OB domain